MGTLLLVDGNNIAHRVQYKFQLSNGVKDVSITYGFFKVLISYLKQFKPDAVIVGWDGGIPKFRRDAVHSYKANRTHHDDLDYENFKVQVGELHNYALPLAGVLSVKQRAVEADDLVYHACVMGDYDNVIVVSADNDLLQCTLLPCVKLFNPNNKEIVDREYIYNTYGIDPALYTSWKALQGDSSDNIAGVPGIGPKTASKLFQHYNNLAAIFAAAEEDHIPGRLGESIRMFGYSAVMYNYEIMDLTYDKTGSRLVLRDAACLWKPANVKQLKRWFIDNAFVSLMEGDVYNVFRRLDMPKYMPLNKYKYPRPTAIYRSPQ